MKKKWLLLPVALLAFTACNGTKKVDYATFREEVVNTAAEVAKNPKKVEKQVINGKMTIRGEETKFSNFTYTSETKITSLSVDEAAVLVAIATASATLTIVEDSEDLTYYVGNGFRVKKDTKNDMRWDKYMNLTSIKSNDDDDVINLTIKYTYAK